MYLRLAVALSAHLLRICVGDMCLRVIRRALQQSMLDVRTSAFRTLSIIASEISHVMWMLQGRITCMAFPYLTDVEFIADAVVARAAADAAAANGSSPRANYAMAVRAHVGITDDRPMTMSQLAAHNVAKVLREAGM